MKKRLKKMERDLQELERKGSETDSEKTGESEQNKDYEGKIG